MVSKLGWIFVLCIHIICCLVVHRRLRCGVLRAGQNLMPLVICVPVWGLLCVILLHLIAISEEKRPRKRDKIRIAYTKYKSIAVEEKNQGAEIIPLEEALILNQPLLCRNLMLDELNKNPEEFVDLLQYARLNEDTEVVHYAATAMAEVSKEYDLRLQKLEQAYTANPEDETLLDKYCGFLAEYIEQGMSQGQMLLVQQQRLGQLLERKTQIGLDLSLCTKLAENQMARKDYISAGKTIQVMEEHWPETEEPWLLKIRFYALQKQGDALKNTLHTIEKRQIYISAGGKELLAFWSGKKEPLSYS